MNRIYKAFDNIKASKELKEQVIMNIKRHRQPINTKKYFFISSAVMASLILTIFVYDYNPFYNNDSKEKDINLTTEYFKIESNDNIFYNHNIYILDSVSANKKILDKKIGRLNQVENNTRLINNLDSYYHNNALVYTIKGIKQYKELAVLDNNQVFIFKIANNKTDNDNK